jgi:hypothetical protein
MIGPGGLLLGASHLLAIPVLVFWVGSEKNNQLHLDMRNIFAGPCNEPHWKFFWFAKKNPKNVLKYVNANSKTKWLS